MYVSSPSGRNHRRSSPTITYRYALTVLPRLTAFQASVQFQFQLDLQSGVMMGRKTLDWLNKVFMLLLEKYF